METNNKKAWLYLLPAGIFLAVFMVYPLIDVSLRSVMSSLPMAGSTFLNACGRIMRRIV